MYICIYLSLSILSHSFIPLHSSRPHNRPQYVPQYQQQNHSTYGNFAFKSPKYTFDRIFDALVGWLLHSFYDSKSYFGYYLV